MADEDRTQDEGQELDSTAQDANTTSGEQDSQDSGQETFDREYVAQLRAESASWRTKFREVEEKLKKLEKKDLSEKERLQADLDEIKKAQEASETALRRERARVAIVKAAQKAGLPADLAERLVEVEFDDDGKPVGVEAAVKKLASEYPQLVQGANGGGSPTNPASGKKSTLTRADIEKMTPEQIDANWEEIGKVLKDL